MTALRLYAPASPDPAPLVSTPGGGLSADMRLSDLYAAYFVPDYHAAKDSRPRTLEAVSGSLAYWIRFTGDPPIGSITREHCLQFAAGLLERPGTRNSRMGANTRRKHISAIQAMLDQCGPRDRDHRDALELIAAVPWINRPGKVKRPPEDCYTLEEIEKLLANCTAATCPPKFAISPGEYMRRLYLLLFNTGMRVGEACQVTWDCYGGNYLSLPARVVAKGRDGRRVALNAAARDIIESMRGVLPSNRRSERIFPWPWSWEKSRDQLYDQHKLIRACLPLHRQKYFACHSIRKLAANELCRINPMGAQKQLGHATSRMTADHYVSENAALEAANQMPQPKWQQERQSRLAFDE
jgi:integrase